MKHMMTIEYLIKVQSRSQFWSERCHWDNYTRYTTFILQDTKLYLIYLFKYGNITNNISYEAINRI